MAQKARSLARKARSLALYGSKGSELGLKGSELSIIWLERLGAWHHVAQKPRSSELSII